MRILVLSDLWIPFPGGAERFVFNVADQLRLRGHGVVVITSYWKARETSGIKVVFHDIGVRQQSAARHADGWSIIARDLAAADPDAILTHGFFAREFEAELAQLGRPIVQVVHNGPRMSCARLAIYNSEWTRAHSNPASQDVTIHPPAFDDVYAGERGELIGFIKPIEHKGVKFFYQIAQALPSERFVVLRGEWILIEDVRALPNVRFMDAVLDVRDFYRRCRIVLVPSLSEDAGTVAQEAAANRTPCISSDVMGLNETNAGGIRLPVPRPECPPEAQGLMVRRWVEEIQKLSGADYYAEVVERQRAALETFRWPEKFDRLSEAICSMNRE